MCSSSTSIPSNIAAGPSAATKGANPVAADPAPPTAAPVAAVPPATVAVATAPEMTASAAAIEAGTGAPTVYTVATPAAKTTIAAKYKHTLAHI